MLIAPILLSGRAERFLSVPSGKADLSALKPVLETALDAVIVMDAKGLVLDWNAHAQETFGWRREEAIGRQLAELIIPETQRQACRAGLEKFAESGEARVLDRRLELTGLRRDGREVPVELSVAKWTDGNGGTVFVGFLRDVTDMRQAADALRESEERLRVTQECAQVGIAETDHEGRYVRVNPAFCAITGFDRDELLGRMTFFDLTHPDDRGFDRVAYGRQVSGDPEPYQLEKRYVRKDGEVIWVNVCASAAYDGEGRFHYGVRVVQDINRRKLAETRQQLLVHELNHRVKNVLGLVKALAAKIGQAAPDLATFNAMYRDRLDALARSHDLLIQEHWRGAGLRDVLTHELEPYAAREMGRPAMRLVGPTVRLDARASISLSLVAHELATNAAKYGALSAPGGTVDLAWRWLGDSEPRCLRLTWTERGGPPVTAPSRRGFGSNLIERLAKGDLRGEVEFDYRAEGLKVAMTICPDSPAA